MSRNLKISGAIVVAFVLGIATLAIAMDSPSDEQVAAAPTPTEALPPVMAGNTHKLSTAPDGKVTLVEFLDFECETCGAIYPAMEQLREEYGDRVTFAIRYFPNDGHFNAMIAAQTVEAAAEQGKLVEMYQRMFETQKEWGEARESKRELFVGFARDIGLDMKQFEADVDDPATVERITSDKADGLALGAQGTPTIFINDRMIELESLDQLKGEIEAALAG
jgi:protein-disulfide isomerase